MHRYAPASVWRQIHNALVFSLVEDRVQIILYAAISSLVMRVLMRCGRRRSVVRRVA